MNPLIQLDKTPQIACVLNDRDVINIDNNSIAKADLIELRIDMFEDITIENIKKTFDIAKDRFGKPIIATVRDTQEGGQKAIADRFSIYEAILPLTDFVDVEITSEVLFKRVTSIIDNRSLIGSYHNFDHAPNDEFLEGIASKGWALGADIIKIAVTARDKSDLIRLLLFTLRHRDSGIITMCMGEEGLPSRIIAPIFGSLITYGYVTKPSAPGQLSINQLSEILSLLNIR